MQRALVLMATLGLLTACGMPVRFGIAAARRAAGGGGGYAIAGAVTRLPRPPPATGPDAIGAVRIEGRRWHGAERVTFSEVLPPGALPSGATLTATMAGHALPTTFDVQRHNADGSARLVVVTIVASRSGDVVLRRGAAS